MEACFVNLVEPGDKVAVCINGVFGARMKENVERAGGVPIMVEDAMGAPVNPNKLEDALKTHRDVRVVAFVHAETSTGAEQLHIKEIADLVHQQGTLFLLDTVTSLGNIPLKIDEWDVDAAYSASQKGLGAPAGLAPITMGTRARSKIENRKSPVAGGSAS